MSKNKYSDLYNKDNFTLKYGTMFDRNIVHQNDNEKINEDLFKDSKCTSMILGVEPILQECYICSICDSTKSHKMCKYCYNTCHSKCREKFQRSETEEFKLDEKKEKDEEFACYCGIRLKHVPDQPKKSKRVVCMMHLIDEAFTQNKYFCGIHNKNICGMCAVECHKECWKENGIKITSEDTNNFFACECRTQKHTQYNEVAFQFPIKEYEELTNTTIWPIQIINVLFGNETIFSNFKNLFKNVFNNVDDKETEKENFYPLLEIFSNYFDRKFKTFYYEEKLLETFKFEYIIKYLSDDKIQEEDLDINKILVKFRLLSVLLFLHLKNDFQDVKTLTSIDFLTNTILERIQYKKLLTVPTIFTKELNSKYNLNNLFKENNILKELALDNIIALMNIGMNKLSIETNLEEFCIGLKYICFMLKKMVFTKQNLIDLITEFNKFHSKLYEHLDSNSSKRYCLIEVYWSLAEIFFLISTTYNDLIFEEYLDTNNNISKTNEDGINVFDFIHVKSEHGTTLFRMVVKTCDIFIRHYKFIQNFDESNLDIDDQRKMNVIAKRYSEILTQLKQQNLTNNFQLPGKDKGNKGIIKEKTITLFNETIKLFCIANNNYLDQIDNITKDDLIQYKSFCKQIDTSYFTTIPKEIGNDILEKLHSLKKSVEINIFFYFCNGSKNGENKKTGQKVIDALNYFNDEMVKILSICPIDNKVENNLINNSEDKEKQKLLNDKKDQTNFDIENNIDQLAEDKKLEALKQYKTQIINNISETYSFITHKALESHIDNFIDCLILSNVDEIIFKLILFLSNRHYPNYVDELLIDKIYPIFQLFFLSKRGIKNFIFGKNLQRLNKILNRFNEKELDSKNKNKNLNEDLNRTRDGNLRIMEKSLNLLNDLLDGLEIYNITINKHKVLLRYKRTLLEHLENLNKISNIKQYNEIFITHLSKIMNIFSKLSDAYETEDYSEIKIRITMLFADSPSNLFDKKIFNSLFKIENIENQQKEVSDNSKLILNENDSSKNSQKSENIIDNKPEEIPNKDNLIKLYFSYFDLMKEKTFYIYNTPEYLTFLTKIHNFNDLDYFKQILNSNQINLEQKTILLAYTRSMYLLDILDHYNLTNQKHCLTNEEYKQIIESHSEGNLQPNAIDIGDNVLELPIEIVKQLTEKENMSITINKVIHFYMAEIYKFPEQLQDKDNIIANKEFFLELLNGIHFISNYCYFEKDIWAYLILSFYEMTLEFIKRGDLFIKVYNEILSNGYAITTNENISEYMQKKVDELTNINFNLYDKKKLYMIMIEVINFIKSSLKLNIDNNFVKFLKSFDEMSEADFTPFSLVENLDYEYFYENEELVDEEKETNADVSLERRLIKYRDDFIQAFKDINNTNFLYTFTTVSNDNVIIDFRQTIINYFNAFINSKESNSINKLTFFIALVEKMLFYDREEMQKRFEVFLTDKYVFENLNRILNNYLVINYSLLRNIYANEQALKVCNLSKLIMQFLQNLGEGFNKTFHNNIFKLNYKVISVENNDSFDEEENEEEDKEENEIKNKNNLEEKKEYKYNNCLPIKSLNYAIYGSIVLHLKRIILSFDLNTAVNCELPYDKLLVTMTSAIDFIIEYIETVGNKKEIVRSNLNNLFFDSDYQGDNIYEKEDHIGIMNILNIKINDENENIKEKHDLYILRRKLICYVKMKIVQLLISYFQSGNKLKEVKLFLLKRCSPIDLYKEILNNFKELLILFEKQQPKKFEILKECKNTESYVDALIELYNHENSFRNIIELPLCLKLYVLIKSFEEIYEEKSISNHFEKMVKISKAEDTDPYNLNLKSEFSEKVHMFLERIVIKVEIKKDEEDEIIEIMKEKSNKFCKKKLTKYKQMKSLAKSLLNYNDNDDQLVDEDEEKESKNGTKINDNEDYDKIQCSNKNNKQYVFFIRPYLSYSLSQHTKDVFENEVDRSTATSKYVELVTESDYFLFESVVNYHTIGRSKFLLLMANLNFNIFERLNYLIIIIQNVLITKHFYLSTDLPPDLYDTADPDLNSTQFNDNFYLCLAHTIILVIELAIFFYFKFPNAYKKNLMHYFDKRFVFKKNPEDKIPQVVVDYFQGRVRNIMSVVTETNKGITILNQIYIAVFPSILFNREINLFIFTAILNIAYLFAKKNMLFVPQVLFIVNIIPTLFDIFLAIKLKFYNMITVLLFTYLIVYLFMWIAFYYFSDLFVYYDIKERESRENIQESFCYSTVQCFLFILSTGVTTGEIDETIVSYQSDYGIFLAKFAFDIIFFILVILILGNVFLGIIVDSLTELREQNSIKEKDKADICFICQLTRDDCLIKNIDFEKHIMNDHSLWNYVYFLIHLCVSNSNDFNRLENNVWEKLNNQDYSWFPKIY